MVGVVVDSLASCAGLQGSQTTPEDMIDVNT